VRRGDFLLVGFPALVDRGDRVSLRLGDNRVTAQRVTRGGLRRLFTLAEQRELKSQVPLVAQASGRRAAGGDLEITRDLNAQLAELLAQRAFVDPLPTPRSAEEFEAARKAGQRELPVAVQDVARLLPSLFEEYHQVCCQLEEGAAVLPGDAAEDLRGQLRELMPERFLVETPWGWLLHFPRYLRAMRLRIEKLRTGGRRSDAQAMVALQPHLARFRNRQRDAAARNTCEPALEEYRWLLEEFRVSLFAQLLGTAVKVSSQRLDRQWAQIH